MFEKLVRQFELEMCKGRENIPLVFKKTLTVEERDI